MIIGYTHLIEEFLARRVNVMFLCQNQQVRRHLFPLAAEYFQHTEAKRTNHTLYFGRTILRYNTLNSNIHGWQGVITIHPELRFDANHRNQGMMEHIAHINQRYMTNGNTEH